MHLPFKKCKINTIIDARAQRFGVLTGETYKDEILVASKMTFRVTDRLFSAFRNFHSSLKNEFKVLYIC